jgi:hypothetical protein
LSDGRIDQQGIGGDEHRIAVGGRLGERRGRHDGAGARAVLDHHRLAAPAQRQEIGKDARHDVGRTAGRERNEEPYRPRWKIGGGLGRGNRGDAAREQENRRDGFHDRHSRFAVRRTLPAALGWAKARKLHRDVQPALPAVSALLAAGEPRKNMPRQCAGARADN